MEKGIMTKRWMTVALFAALALTACDDKSKTKTDDTKATADAAKADGAKDAKDAKDAKPGDHGPEHGHDHDDDHGHDHDVTDYVDPGAEDPQPVTNAVAVMHPTKGSEVKGTVMFSKVDDGIKVTTEVAGLTGDKHAYHIHVFGDCSGEDGKTAGTHFHFKGSSMNQDGVKYITGNLGDLEAKEGVAKHEAVIKGASFQGKYSILGRAVIIHAKPNDPNAPPIGAAGARVACGVIGLKK